MKPVAVKRAIQQEEAANKIGLFVGFGFLLLLGFCVVAGSNRSPGKCEREATIAGEFVTSIYNACLERERLLSD